MAFELTCQIDIGSYRITSIHEVSITSSWREGTSCQIMLPNLGGQLERLFKTGQKVAVSLGYNGRLREEFTGFIAKIKPKIPFEVLCEDQMYLLKRDKVQNKEWTSTDLKTVLNHVLRGFKAQISADLPNVRLSPFVLHEVTAAQALQKLKDEYFLAVYFRGDTLFVGLPYTEILGSRLGARATYHLTGPSANIVSDQGLEFIRKEDLKIKTEVINILPNNTRQKVTIGDLDGETRTIILRSQSPQTEANLKKLGQTELDRLKFDGYQGNLEAFGEPYLIHSAVANLIDEVYPERRGRYVVDQVAVTFGQSGFRRVSTLGKRVSL